MQQAVQKQEVREETSLHLAKFDNGLVTYYGFFVADGREAFDEFEAKLGKNQNYLGIATDFFVGNYKHASEMAKFLYERLHAHAYQSYHDRDICFFFKSDKSAGATVKAFREAAKAYKGALESRAGYKEYFDTRIITDPGKVAV